MLALLAYSTASDSLSGQTALCDTFARYRAVLRAPLPLDDELTYRCARCSDEGVQRSLTAPLARSELLRVLKLTSLPPQAVPGS